MRDLDCRACSIAGDVGQYSITLHIHYQDIWIALGDE